MEPENKKITIINPQSLIERAIDQNVPVESLERLFELQKQIRYEMAVQAYREAMTRFQANCPPIKKTKKVLNKNGQLRYKYAPLEDIIKQVKKYIEDNGFSYSFSTRSAELGMEIICIISHVMGHQEESIFTIPFEESEYMTIIQRSGSTLTYGKRYAFCNGFGIMTADTDTDGAPPTSKSEIQKDMINEINKLSDKVKKGFLILGYGPKIAYEFCERFGWDEKEITKQQNLIIDTKANK